jgi:hypothetical protein
VLDCLKVIAFFDCSCQHFLSSSLEKIAPTCENMALRCLEVVVASYLVSFQGRRIVRYCRDCNCGAVLLIPATSSEVAKPFWRFVFLAVTRAANGTPVQWRHICV